VNRELLMSEADAIVIHAHPTESDYQDALAGHAQWANMRARAAQVRPLGIVALVVLVGVCVLAVKPEWVYDGRWVMNPLPLVMSVVLYPVMVLALALRTMLRTPASRDKPMGIVERPIVTGGRVSPLAVRAMLLWAIILVLVVALYFVMSRRARSAAAVAAALAAAQSSGATNAPAGEPVLESASEVPGAYLLAASLAIASVSVGLVAWAQRSRGARNLVASTPALLQPRTWEFHEDWLAERGEMLQTTMKWTYLLKFLETPRQVLLYPNEQSFYLVPKAAFVSEMQFAQFMALLMRKVPSGVMQPRAGRGFPIAPIGITASLPPPPRIV
jgi:hypothetical protein